MTNKFKEPAQLHNHSYYSLLDAVPSPKEWLAWCLESKTPGMAICDHGTAISMYDSTRFPAYIKEYNEEHETDHPEDAVIGIPSVELYVKINEKDRKHYHIVVWAVSEEGYHNLIKLASVAYQDTVKYFGSLKARVTYDTILQYRKGLKFGSACIANPMGKAVMDNDLPLAEKEYLKYQSMFGDDLYIEFHASDLTHNFDHKTGRFKQIASTTVAPDSNYQKAYNRFLADMIDKHGGAPIPVTDAHFIRPEDKILQDCLLKAGNDNGWYFHQSYHQKTADQMYHKLVEHLGSDWLTEERYQQWIDNTYQIMDLAKNIKINYEYHLPEIDIPDYIKVKTDDYNKQTYYYMMQKIKEHGRWHDDPEYIERFKKEIDVIMDNKTLNFIPYFLLYEDICTHARSQGFLQNIARGSAGGSLVSYYLKIIHVDPIKSHLPFERFLSHARIRAGSFPDIDADFGDTARPVIIQYLRDKYQAGFAQISTFARMKTKNAIKDAMWAIYGRNRNDPEVAAVCRTIPDSMQGVEEKDFLYGYTDKEGHYNTGEIETNEILSNFFTTYPDIENMVKKLIGIIRGWSRHASAFVISTIDLPAERVPILMMPDKDMVSLPVTQFEASMIDKCKLVKADILGIKTLTAVTECVKLVKERTGIDYLEEDEWGVQSLYRLPEDEAVYADFYNKDTDSSFQFNTDLIKGYLQDFIPTTRKHLADMTAICRPGALDAPFEDTTAAKFYMDVRNGKRQLTYLHPDLEPILKDSNGIFCYQEEIMKFLVDIVGYTWEESDLIRNAIAKKKHAVMMETFGRIRTACKARGWDESQVETVCKQIQAFSKYSFNKSHAHAYAELGYITMYLKHYHKLEWWTSILNLHLDNETKMRKDIELLDDLVKPPSLVNPSTKFVIHEDREIVAPISAIKGIGPKAVIELTSKGPYLDLKDFVTRVNHLKVNIGAFSALIKAKAADCLLDKKLSYVEARQKLMDDYKALRRKKLKTFQGKFRPEMEEHGPLNLFLMEREANMCFNKSLLDDKGILAIIQNRWTGLKPIDKKSIPFLMGDIPVVRNIKMAERLLKRGYEKEVGLILLFEQSLLKQGVSKKNNRPYSMVKIALSDGYSTVECIKWDMTKPLRWNKNSIVYVRGTLKAGWKTPVSLTLSEIEKIEINND